MNSIQHIILNKELMLRRPHMAAQYVIMTMVEQRSFLLGLIKIEEKNHYIDQDDGKLAICMLELAIPCILYCKNRCREKILN